MAQLAPGVANQARRVIARDDSADREDLRPAEALASTKAAREALVRRVNLPWMWHAVMAVGIFAVECFIVRNPVLGAVGGPAFIVAAVLVTRARERRIGVMSDITRGRDLDAQGWWMTGAAWAFLVLGLLLRERWELGALVAVAASAVTMFAIARRSNSRLIARIRDAE